MNISLLLKQTSALACTSCDCYQTSSGWRYFSLLEKQFLDFMAAVLESYSSLQTNTQKTPDEMVSTTCTA